MAAEDITVADVEAVSSTGWTNLTSVKKSELLEIAVEEVNTVYTARVSTLPTLEGSEDVFTRYLAAHKFEVAEGGEASNENSGGGSVQYNTVTGDYLESLSTTRYGREALKHLRENQSIGVVRSW